MTCLKVLTEISGSVPSIDRFISVPLLPCPNFHAVLLFYWYIQESTALYSFSGTVRHDVLIRTLVLYSVVSGLNLGPNIGCSAVFRDFRRLAQANIGKWGWNRPWPFPDIYEFTIHAGVVFEQYNQHVHKYDNRVLWMNATWQSSGWIAANRFQKAVSDRRPTLAVGRLPLMLCTIGTLVSHLGAETGHPDWDFHTFLIVCRWTLC